MAEQQQANPDLPQQPDHPQPPRTRQRKAGRGLANVAYLAALLGVLGGLLWVWLSKTHVKGGILVISGAFLLAAVVRLMLPDERAGLLANRRRGLDVTAFTTLAIALLAAALILPSPS